MAALAGTLWLAWAGTEGAARAQQTTDPTAVWARLLGALNAGDANAAAALFAPDALFEQAGSACATPCTGREAIMQQLQAIVSSRPSLSTLPGVSISDNVVNGRLQVQSDATTMVESFSMAALGDQIIALRVGAPMGTSLESAGGGGLIQAPRRLPFMYPLLAVFAVALGYAGLRLLHESAAG